MRKFSVITLLIVILFSNLSPLWDISSVRAVFDDFGTYGISKDVPNDKNSKSIDLSEIFNDDENEKNSGDFVLSNKSVLAVPGTIGTTKAILKVKLTLNKDQEPARDDGTIENWFDSSDYRGGWNAILNNTLEFESAGGANGIYLQLFEAKNGATAKDIDSNPEDYDITYAGPYYGTSRIKFPGTNQNIVLERSAFRRTINTGWFGSFVNVNFFGLVDFSVQSYNIGSFFWRINPSQDFFGKRFISANIPLTDLKPNTKYYYRIDIEEAGGSNDEAVTQISESFSFTTKTEAEGDITLEELESLSGTSAGSSEEGNTPGNVIMGQEIGCSLTGDWTGCFLRLYYSTIYYASAWLTRAAAGIMDIFMAYSLSDFMYRNAFIETGWKLVRDVCNMLFIFILLWTAFKMVINDHHYHANKVIVNIIIIGLLLNFSLFFTKVVIDVGNITARVFYNQIRITASKELQDDLTSSFDADTLGIQPQAISSAIADGFGFGKLENSGYDALNQSGGLSYGTIFLLITLNIIIYLLAAWIFIKTSFAFLGRILSLWMAMIFSPFAFTSTIIEGHGGHGGPLDIKRLGWKDWLGNLLDAAFYPSVFLFFIFLIMVMISGGFLSSTIKNFETLSGTAFIITFILNALFLLGLLKTAGEFAGKMSGSFGGIVTEFAGKAAAFVGGAAIGLATGGVAWAGRNTLGRMAGIIGTDDRVAALQEKAAKGGVSGYFARQGLKTIQGAQKSSFDVRQTSIANTISAKTGMNMNALGKVPGLQFLSTNASAGGIEGVKERKIAKMKARADSLGENKVKKTEIENKIKEKKEQIELKEEEVAQKKAALQQDKADGGRNQSTLQKAVNDAEKDLRDLKKSGRWTTEDVGTPGGPGGVPPAIPARKKADGSNVTLADVGKKRDLPISEIGLDELEAALKNNSKALAREYMSNKIRNMSPAHIDEDTKDAFGNITEFGHAHGLETTNNLLRKLVQGLNPFNDKLGVSLSAAVSGSLTNRLTAVFGLSNSIKEFTERRANDYIHEVDHATAVSDGKDHGHHGPKYKDNYKGPSMNIFSGLFGGGSGGSGHDDHGHGDHDDHGHH